MQNLPRHAAGQRRPGLGVGDPDLDVRVDAAHRRHPAFERVVGPGLGGDRRGLGHPVADRHLRHPHPVHDLLHDLDRARRARHHAGAQRAEVVRPRRVRVEYGELGDEHGGHPVERRAALGRDRGQRGRRVERRCRVDDARPSRGGAQIADHHAEDVEQRHRDADPVPLGVPAHLPDDVGVVEDVVVAERGPLGVPGGARRVLDVDRVVRVEGRLVGGEGRRVSVPVVQRVPLGAPDQHDLLEPGAVRRHFGDHRRVVGRLERARRDEQPDPRLDQHVLQLVGPVGRVDADEDDADLGRGVLQLHPFRAVRGPDADAVALRDAAAQQAAGERIDLGAQLGVGESAAGGVLDQRVPVTVRRRGAIEVVADGLLEQRGVGGTAVVGRGGLRLPYGELLVEVDGRGHADTPRS